ncbi:MAG TPA: hypothetical protein PLO51_06060, partial [Candidatus Micrarchaeota archaeon]|nr:hypothetical protein [Candidatus Micrarchaeota archaeon]
NPDRNVKIFNSVAAPGFSLGSSGSPAGLLDLYNTPYSSLFSSMSVTDRPQNLLVEVRSNYGEPLAGVSVQVTNDTNNSQFLKSANTSYLGFANFTHNFSSNGDATIFVGPTVASGRLGMSYIPGDGIGATTQADIISAAGYSTLYLKSLGVDAFNPDGTKSAYYF